MSPICSETISEHGKISISIYCIFKIHLQLIDVKNQTYFREIWGDEVIKVHKYVQHLVAEKSKTEDMEEAKKSIEANFYDIYRPILNYTNENYEVIVKYEY